jgi:hypothetical protein
MTNNNWVEKIVHNWNHVHYNSNGDITACLLSDRQTKFLHLKRCCYFNCPWCYKEAMDYLKQGGDLHNVDIEM